MSRTRRSPNNAHQELTYQSVVSGPELDPHQYLQKARELYDQGKFSDAKKLVNGVIKALKRNMGLDSQNRMNQKLDFHPDDKRDFVNAIKLKLEFQESTLSRRAKAALFNQICTVDPENEHAWSQMVALNEESKFPRRHGVLQTAFHLHPAQPKIAYLHAKSLAVKGALTDAFEVTEDAMQRIVVSVASAGTVKPLSREEKQLLGIAWALSSGRDSDNIGKFISQAWGGDVRNKIVMQHRAPEWQHLVALGHLERE